MLASSNCYFLCCAGVQGFIDINVLNLDFNFSLIF